MSKVRLGDYVRIKTGKLDANAASPDGDYPFFTCAVEPLKIDKYSYDCECVLVAGNGDLNVKYYNGKFDAYQRTYIIESIDKTHLCVPYLYRFLDNYIDTLRSQSIGGVIKYIKLGNLTEAPIFVPSIETQNKTVKLLSFLDSLIEKAYQQNKKLDELVKSRFVEMFGDLGDPKTKWERFSLIYLCNQKGDIKCGPFGTQLSKDEYTDSGIAIWEIPQINSAFSLPPTHFLTKEKAHKLQEYSLIAGDIAMSRKGNVGRCAIFPDEFDDGIIHSDVLRIRLNKRKVNPVFIMCQLHFSRYVTKQIELVSHGAIMAGINVTKLKDILLHVPPLELQNQFADFVAKVEQQKAIVKKIIDKLETLKKSLMQEYFG